MELKTNDIHISVELQQLITAEMAQHYRVVPAEKTNNALSFYALPSTFEMKDELQMLMGCKIEFIEVESSTLEKALSVYYRTNEYKKEEGEINLKNDDFLEKIIFEANSIGSSDIHFEVFEDEARIRLRIDGLLIEKYSLQKDQYLELVNKIKIKSSLDITEKRLPQDGRINYDEFDIRVSILPSLHGEKIVMRLLGKDASEISLDQLGFEKEEKEIYLEGVNKTNGIVLISGPTGSGKTTTLYATLKLLNDIKRNIVTVEDPIEYTLKGITQVQLKENIGLTFTAALRSFLRQDPDIIMLGEIRDAETAKMAIRAALTGHLVLSTIHTNSALGTITRLVDMGVPAYLIGETLNVSVAQRLLRKLCDCKKEVLFDASCLPRNYKMPFPIEKNYIPNGCEKCHYTGYKGRTAIYEVVPVQGEITTMIKSNPHKLEEEGAQDIERLSFKAFKLFAEGITSIEEIYSLLIQ